MDVEESVEGNGREERGKKPVIVIGGFFCVTEGVRVGKDKME